MSITETLQLSFDYAALDDDTRLTVETHTDALKGLVKKTAGQIWEIGDRLLQVKAALPHGQFLGWLEHEFDWAERTARNFMRVATVFKSATVADLNIAPTALYQLASDETPDEVREFVLERAANGHAVKKADVGQAIAAAKPKFQIGDWVSGIDFKNGGVVEGRIHSIGNKYLVLESGVNVTVGTATVLEPYPQTDDLALTPSIEDSEETHGFKPGDIVAGFYNPTEQYEVGELESYSPSAYSLLVKSDGARCGVVTNTLRYPTEAEEDEYFAPAPAPANEPAAFIASRSGTDEHYTPDWVWKPALEVIEGQKFGLDPASNSHHSPKRSG